MVTVLSLVLPIDSELILSNSKIDITWFFSFFFHFFHFSLFVSMYTGAGILVGYLCLLPIISSCTDGSVKSTLYYLHALGVSCIAYILLNSSNNSSSTSTSSADSEIYGLKHLLFNIELPPKTLWFNMGLWDKPNLTFPQACENLVNAVTKLMDLQPRSKILGKGGKALGLLF